MCFMGVTAEHTSRHVDALLRSLLIVRQGSDKSATRKVKGGSIVRVQLTKRTYCDPVKDTLTSVYFSRKRNASSTVTV